LGSRRRETGGRGEGRQYPSQREKKKGFGGGKLTAPPTWEGVASHGEGPARGVKEHGTDRKRGDPVRAGTTPGKKKKQARGGTTSVKTSSINPGKIKPITRKKGVEKRERGSGSAILACEAGKNKHG